MAVHTLLFLMAALVTFRAPGEVKSDSIIETNYRQRFSKEVVPPSFFMSAFANRPMACGALCGVYPSCRSFAFNSVNRSCWLYDRQVGYKIESGTAAPGTRYFWRLFRRCPSELNYTILAGVCSRIHNTLHLWDEARQLCENEGATLFIGDTLEKLTALRASTVPDPWLGAFRDEQEDKWYWLDGTKLLKDSHLWDAGQPNNNGGDQNMVRLTNSGRLGDIDAARRFLPLCQMDTL